MQYAKIKNDKIEKYPYNEGFLTEDHPSTSFPSDPLNNADVRESFSVVQVFPKAQTSFNERTQFCKRGNPAFKNGKWEQTWNVSEKSPEEVTADEGFKWIEIRNQRNQKLLDSDWQMVKALETGEDASDLRNYRQKLRDIPQDQANPFSITWPEL
jgi:hypothetical protein